MLPNDEFCMATQEIRQVEELKEWAQYCSLGSAFIHRLGTVVRSGGLGTVTEESLKQMGVLPKLRSAILAAIAAKLAWRPFKKCRMGREDIELVEDLSRLNKARSDPKVGFQLILCCFQDLGFGMFRDMSSLMFILLGVELPRRARGSRCGSTTIGS